MHERTDGFPVAMSEMFGVTFPDWLPVFDCRQPEGGIRKDPSGTVSVYASELAEYALGLRSYADGIYNATTPMSTSWPADSRRPEDQEYIAECLRSMIKHAERLKAVYDSIDPNLPTDGGGCYFKLVAIGVGNYGASIIADKRDYRVLGFRS